MGQGFMTTACHLTSSRGLPFYGRCLPCYQFDFLKHPSSSSFVLVSTAHRWILPRLLLGYAPDALFSPSPLDFLPVVALALQQGLLRRPLRLTLHSDQSLR